jgi:hypothetical protein
VTSLASNEIFSLSTKIIVVIATITPGIIIIENYININRKETIRYETVIAE